MPILNTKVCFLDAVERWILFLILSVSLYFYMVIEAIKN